MTELLVADEIETITYINQLTDELIIKDISAVFDDVAKELQSDKFIACIELPS